MQITILGSSSAIPSMSRNTAAQVVKHNERLFLLDCGEGTQMQLIRNKLNISRINFILISHLHGDHVFGIFGLLATMSMSGRKSVLNIVAHEPFENILKTHFESFQVHLTFTLNFITINTLRSEIIYEDRNLEIMSFPLLHRVPCSGFLFKEKPKLLNIRKEMIDAYQLKPSEIIEIKKGRDFITPDGRLVANNLLTYHSSSPVSYAYCTDTLALESTAMLVQKVNVLYHETTFLDRDEDLARKTWHSTTKQAGRIAKLADVEKLIIGHFSTRYKKDTMFLEETKCEFENTILAKDGLVVDLC